jgi:tRNA nucleotidyltransferase (CCA-adding enzyme)
MREQTRSGTAIVVMKGAMRSRGEPIESLVAHLRDAHPELETVREAATEPVYVVGGAVRDLLLGRDRADLDLLVEGDATALSARLGAETVEHERFATAKVTLGSHEVDIASARLETYAHPGALPDVAIAAGIEADLGRRDFTINAMAIPLQGEPRLIDPHDGRVDLEAGRLRVLHQGSFVDDPTRAIRAARYAGRFGFELEPETAELLRVTDLGTVSADRREAELRRLAGEATAPRALALLCEWGLLEPREGGVELAARVDELLAASPWRELVPRGPALLAAALGPVAGERDLTGARPARPSEGVELARGHDAVELALARALGAGWLDEYVDEWRLIELEIDGGDLIAAGVPQGPALGRGLAAALRAKLDGEIEGRDQELATALAAASAE